MQASVSPQKLDGDVRHGVRLLHRAVLLTTRIASGGPRHESTCLYRAFKKGTAGKAKAGPARSDGCHRLHDEDDDLRN